MGDTKIHCEWVCVCVGGGGGGGGGGGSKLGSMDGVKEGGGANIVEPQGQDWGNPQAVN